MEMVHHETRRKASKISLEGEDVINSMPENVMTNIMDRLPLKDAVGTSILSTSWRFNWTLLTQLVFDMNFFDNLSKRNIHFSKTNISRLLLHLKGAVTNFSLSIVPDDIKLDDEDIHHLIMFLSRKGGLKELTLSNWLKTPIKLPTHLFSCLELKHLKLHSCVLSLPPYFLGFPKLLSLHLVDVRFHGHKCGQLIAQSPLLETLVLVNTELEVKLAEIAKLENLKVLSLSMCLIDNMTMVRLSSVFQHMSLLRKLQELNLDFGNSKFLAEDDVAHNPVVTTFPCLKSLLLRGMDFSSHSMLSCAFGLLFGCANLQTLDIIGIYKNVVPPPAIFSPELDCNTMGQLQLRNVVLVDIKGWENEVCLIKYMLACSPMLETLMIVPNSSMESNGGNEKYNLASKLLNLPRASPIAKIIF